MGNCSTTSHSVDPGQKQADKAITAALKKDTQKNKNESVMLLLGTGDSGKSTIAKQMRILSKLIFSVEEQKNYNNIIKGNIVLYIMILIKQVELRNYPFESPEIIETLKAYDFGEGSNLTTEYALLIKRAFQETSIQKVLREHSSEFQLSDSAPYFMSNAERFCQEGYLPTDEDILRVRVKTTGISEIQFEFMGESFRMIDVGGQRSERKKWIHCFADVHALFYIVALSDYDLVLEENLKVNRMQESLRLFQEIVNNAWFRSTPVVLFLNKQDLFLDKISTKSLTICFPEYTGNDENKAKDFILNKFLQCNQNKDRKIFPYFTTALDTKNIENVFDAAKKNVVRKSLDETFPGL